MKYQLNKPSLQKIQRNLAMRVHALPVLKAKEAALRLEIQKNKEVLRKLRENVLQLRDKTEAFVSLWSEYPGLLRITEIQIESKSIASTKVSVLAGIKFENLKSGLFHQRAWVVRGTEILREIIRLKIETDIEEKNGIILHDARKKVTQKVNLYEKVQIPEYIKAIRSIRTFLDDKENLSRAAQKIVKQRTREVGAA